MQVFYLCLSSRAFRKRSVVLFKGEGSWNSKLWGKNFQVWPSQMTDVYAPPLNRTAHAHTLP